MLKKIGTFAQKFLGRKVKHVVPEYAQRRCKSAASKWWSRNAAAPETPPFSQQQQGTQPPPFSIGSSHQVMSTADLQQEVERDVLSIMERAGENGRSFSQEVNVMSPEALLRRGRSSFAEIMQARGWYSTDHPDGFFRASLCEELISSPVGQVCVYDICQRSYHGRRATRSIVSDDSSPQGSPANPTSGDGRPSQDIAAPFDLNEVIGNMADIPDRNYQPSQWVYSKEAMTREPVEPTEDVPQTTLGDRAGVIHLQKWGNRFVIPYETLRGNRIRVNKLASMFALEGATARIQQLEELAKVGYLGDGTTDSLPTIANGRLINLTTLDTAASASTLTSAAWTGIQFLFDLPYTWTHSIMGDAAAKDLINLTLPNSRTHYGEITNVGAEGYPVTDIMNGATRRVRVGILKDMVDTHIVNIDARYGFELISQAGSDISEQAKIIRNQTEEFVITWTYAFGQYFFPAVQVVKFDA